MVQKQLRKKLRLQQEKKANLESERRKNESVLAAKSKSFENSEIEGIKVGKKAPKRNCRKLQKLPDPNSKKLNTYTPTW